MVDLQFEAILRKANNLNLDESPPSSDGDLPDLNGVNDSVQYFRYLGGDFYEMNELRDEDYLLSPESYL